MSETTIVNLRMPADLKQRAQAYADAHYMTLTALIVKALLEQYPEFKPK